MVSRCKDERHNRPRTVSAYFVFIYVVIINTSYTRDESMPLQLCESVLSSLHTYWLVNQPNKTSKHIYVCICATIVSSQSRCMSDPYRSHCDGSTSTTPGNHLCLCSGPYSTAIVWTHAGLNQQTDCYHPIELSFYSLKPTSGTIPAHRIATAVALNGPSSACVYCRSYACSGGGESSESGGLGYDTGRCSSPVAGDLASVGVLPPPTATID
jgi:hypothetical protein